MGSANCLYPKSNLAVSWVATATHRSQSFSSSVPTTNLVKAIAQVLKETGLEPQYLELEITESLVIQDVDFTNQS